MNRIAIIDLGTNTFNLLIAGIKVAPNYETVYQTKVSVKLGEGGIDKGFITSTAFQRGVDALKKYKEIIDGYNVLKVIAIATSAIRGASNGNEFVKVIKEECGIEIQTISGDKEAEYIYWGVREALKMDDVNPSLIIDIGGGSTEFIIANNKEIYWKQSFLLGAARLLEMFKPSNPITDEEVDLIIKYFKEELKPLFDAVKKYPIRELIGSSGSFDSLAELISIRYYTPDILEGLIRQ